MKIFTGICKNYRKFWKKNTPAIDNSTTSTVPTPKESQKKSLVSFRQSYFDAVTK